MRCLHVLSTNVSSCSPQPPEGLGPAILFFADGETEAQSDETACPGSHSWAPMSGYLCSWHRCFAATVVRLSPGGQVAVGGGGQDRSQLAAETCRRAGWSYMVISVVASPWASAAYLLGAVVLTQALPAQTFPKLSCSVALGSPGWPPPRICGTLSATPKGAVHWPRGGGRKKALAVAEQRCRMVTESSRVFPSSGTKFMQLLWSEGSGVCHQEMQMLRTWHGGRGGEQGITRRVVRCWHCHLQPGDPPPTPGLPHVT